jgi:hypothetical protein
VGPDQAVRVTWESLGGPVQGGPAAASLGPGHLDVFVRGTDNALYYKEGFGSTGWQKWPYSGP